ncbi:patatin family protein [Pseudoclavibacter chungangensis]|uniref:Patatin family protein n=2 Tax=Pseudoclavibacter chungangensis TaxID=587635 RepID=A0A7J5BMJ6_9MICO|nr:patatin family protein [Pseudoclavibacter chungangensis]
MRASYTSAMVVALLEAGVHADYVAGISAGSSNTANYLSRDPARARRSFVEFAADPRFGDLRTFVRGEGMFNARYIYEETGLPDQALPFDFATFRANPARFRVGAFQCSTGRNVWWGRDDVREMHDLMVRVRASSTMPVVMPPVTIDGEVYVDGALGRSGGIPLDIARADGFERFLVVLTRPRGYRKGPSRLDGFYRRHFRRWPAVVDALRKRPHRYNETREELFRLEREGRAYLFVPDSMPVDNGERSVTKLRRSHELGLAQARREMPAIREFLGL